MIIEDLIAALLMLGYDRKTKNLFCRRDVELHIYSNNVRINIIRNRMAVHLCTLPMDEDTLKYLLERFHDKE